MKHPPDYEAMLQEQYRKYRGGRNYPSDYYPKSHWVGCEWSRGPIVLPSGAPARLISCNGCLRRSGHIRVAYCNPRLAGWPNPEPSCPQCDYGNDCETWLRVASAGADVEKVLQMLDPEAIHPVTWMETGLIPFHEPGTETGDMFFEDKESLDQYCDNLLARYPVKGGYLLPAWQPTC